MLGEGVNGGKSLAGPREIPVAVQFPSVQKGPVGPLRSGQGQRRRHNVGVRGHAPRSGAAPAPDQRHEQRRSRVEQNELSFRRPRQHRLRHPLTRCNARATRTMPASSSRSVHPSRTRGEPPELSTSDDLRTASRVRLAEAVKDRLAEIHPVGLAERIVEPSSTVRKKPLPVRLRS